MELTFLWQTFKAKNVYLLLMIFPIGKNSILLCDVDKIFSIICVDQFGRVHDGG
jgi:hypothetical protein